MEAKMIYENEDIFLYRREDGTYVLKTPAEIETCFSEEDLVTVLLQELSRVWRWALQLEDALHTAGLPLPVTNARR